MVPNDSPNVPAPPPGLSKEHLDAVSKARAYITGPSAQRLMVTPAEVDGMLADLLTSYEVMSARLAWLAATYAEQAADWKGLMDQ